MVPPNEFIPLAEETGLIMELGDWVIEEACRAASTWPEHITVARQHLGQAADLPGAAEHGQRSDPPNIGSRPTGSSWR